MVVNGVKKQQQQQLNKSRHIFNQIKWIKVLHSCAMDDGNVWQEFV